MAAVHGSVGHGAVPGGKAAPWLAAASVADAAHACATGSARQRSSGLVSRPYARPPHGRLSEPLAWFRMSLARGIGQAIRQVHCMPHGRLVLHSFA